MKGTTHTTDTSLPPSRKQVDQFTAAHHVADNNRKDLRDSFSAVPAMHSESIVEASLTQSRLDVLTAIAVPFPVKFPRKGLSSQRVAKMDAGVRLEIVGMFGPSMASR